MWSNLYLSLSFHYTIIICFLAAPKATLSHWRGDGLIHQMIITTLSLFRYMLSHFNPRSTFSCPSFIRFSVNKYLLVHILVYMWCSARFSTICTILKNVKITHRGVLLLVRLQASASACNFTESNNPPWVFFKFFKL